MRYIMDVYRPNGSFFAKYDCEVPQMREHMRRFFKPGYRLEEPRPVADDDPELAECGGRAGVTPH